MTTSSQMQSAQGVQRRPSNRRLLGALGLVAALVAPSVHPTSAGAQGAAVSTDVTDWFEFVSPWNDASASAVSNDDLLIDFVGQDPTTVIDSRGQVESRADGHLYFANTNTRARFYGVNLAQSAAFPTHAEADAVAARLAKLGFNAVRFHQIDRSAPEGLYPAGSDNTQRFDPVQIDRLDYLVGQLRDRGIYVMFSLRDARVQTNADGVTQASEFAATGIWSNKNATQFDPVLGGLTQDFATRFLDRVNPYTGKRVGADPQVMSIQLHNEDHLFRGFISGSSELNYDPNNAQSLPEFYSGQLDGWSTVGGGSDLNRLDNPGFDTGLTSWNRQRVGTSQFTLARFDDPQRGSVAKIDIAQSSSQPWHGQFRQPELAVQAGHSYVVSFWAKSTGVDSVVLTGALTRTPFNSVGLWRRVTLSNEWQRYEYQFTASETDFGSTKLSFEFGASSPGQLLLDDVSFREADPTRGWLGWLEDKYGTTQAISAAWGGTPVRELVSNGSFEQGAADWTRQTVQPATATLTIDQATAAAGSSSARFDVISTGSAAWNAQIFQRNVDLVAGQRYRLTFAAKASVAGPIVAEAWSGFGLWRTPSLTTDWANYSYEFTASKSGASRLNFAMGQQARAIWLDNVSVTAASGASGLEQGESLEVNSIRRATWQQRTSVPVERWRDQIEWMADQQTAYLEEIAGYLRNELNVAAPILVGDNRFFHLPQIETFKAADLIDNHVYWDHPRYGDNGGWNWNPNNWRINQTAWVNQPFAGLYDVATSAVQGKPVAVSEFNSAAPNKYEAEAQLILPTVAAYQDWDALFLFAYAHARSTLRSTRIVAQLDIAGNPMDLGMAPLAARQFLVGQVAAASSVSVSTFTQDAAADSTLRVWRGGAADELRARGVQPGAVFASELRLGDLSAGQTNVPVPAASNGPRYVTPNNQLTWDVSQQDRGFYKVDAPAYQAVVGFLKGRSVGTTSLDASFSGNAAFATLVVQSRTSAGIGQSNDLLLGALTRGENTGQQWTPDYQSVSNWGSGPTLVEPMVVAVRLRVSNPGSFTVTALNGAGQPIGTIASQVVNGELRFTLDTEQTGAVWYSLTR